MTASASTPEALDVARLVAGAAADVTLLLDPAGIIRQVSVADGGQPIEEAESWVGRPWIETVTGETRGKVEALLKEVAQRGASRRRQVNHPSEQGADIPVAYAAVRIGSRPGSILAVGRDLRGISTLQQRLVEAQQAMERDYWRLRNVETRYRLLFQLATEAILLIDATTMRIADANAAAGELFDEPTPRLVGRTFPFGFSGAALRALDGAIAAARSSGSAGDVSVTVNGETPARVGISCFRQDSATYLLARFATTGAIPSGGTQGAVAELIARSPDAFVVTDVEGRIRTANAAFLELAQLGSEEQARGELLGEWIGRPGADLPVFLAMLKRNGAVRLAPTSSRGEHGATAEVEVSAAGVLDGDDPCVGFVIRDVGRRLAHGPQGARDLTRAVEQLTSLVGRVSLRDLVRDTIDLVERHFIEASLELTQGNRTSAAEVLGVSRQSLYVKMRRHKLIDAADAELALPEPKE
jgi:transcriptional regulator PpsR